MLPSLVTAQDVANTDEDKAPAAANVTADERILDLLRDTVAKQQKNIEYYQEITRDIERAQDKKKYNLLFIGYIIPIYIPSMITEQNSIRNGRDDKEHYNSVERRLERYNNAQYKFDIKPTKMRARRADIKQDKYLYRLAAFFMDDPASALYFMQQNYDSAEFEKIFLEMTSGRYDTYEGYYKQYSAKAGRLLSNFNKVISAPEGTFDTDALKKLASLKTEEFYARLAEYADIKLKQKQIKDKFFKKNQSKAEKVILKELKKRGDDSVALPETLGTGITNIK
jgi:hypothetical protein